MAHQAIDLSQTDVQWATVGPVDVTDLKVVLWDNLSAAMVRRWGRENLTRLAREAHLGPATLARVKLRQTSIGLDVLERLADALAIEPFRLLVPPDDDQAPLTRLSGIALDVAESLDQITDPTTRQQAYSLAMHAIQAVADSATAESAAKPTLLPPRKT